MSQSLHQSPTLVVSTFVTAFAFPAGAVDTGAGPSCFLRGGIRPNLVCRSPCAFFSVVDDDQL